MKNKTQMKRPQGFSLMEIVVALGIVGILVSAVTPMILNRIAAAEITRAQGDVENLAEAIATFRYDTKQYPIRQNSTTYKYYQVLLTDGEPYAVDSWIATGVRDTMADHLLLNNRGYAEWDPKIGIGWNGPYLSKNVTDPWGRQYAIILRPIVVSSGAKCWILSHGPNGANNTGASADALGGDDVGVRFCDSSN